MSNGRDCGDEQSLPTENCISGTAATPRPFSPENRRTMPGGGSAAKGGERRGKPRCPTGAIRPATTPPRRDLNFSEEPLGVPRTRRI